MRRLILALVLSLSVNVNAEVRGHMRHNCLHAYPYSFDLPYGLDLREQCYKAQKSSLRWLRNISRPYFLRPSEWREKVNVCYRDSPGLVLGIDYVAALRCVNRERQRIITEHKRNEGYEAYHRDDYARAIRNWRPLARAGDAASQILLGVMYEHGRGVRKDYVQGEKYE